MLSVIIITKNEEHAIADCLRSVSWADEIIVLDSGSDDATVSICKEHGAKVTQTDWPGFGPQKNRALALATGEWILSIDADERVTPELRAEIQAALSANKPQLNAFRIPRKSSYCGRFIKHGGWSPDYVTRLFRRDTAKFSNDLVHEKLLLQSAIGTLLSPLQHITYNDLEEVLEKINLYSSLGALNANKNGLNGNLFMAISHALWAFLRTYILRTSFLDGAEGLMLAISNAEVTYYRYLKLYYLNKNSSQIKR